ncbi:MAG: phosphoenolpyruvate synthase [Paludibacteraceae bacterium]|jgi:CheY-like chemotaxis protein|nr:phosphoenolpyruvate synthase [Paludibacteraceae bacterium]
MDKKNTDLKQLYFKDTSFANLMQKRIYNILLLASKYDAFALEEDGRIDEQIFNEYTSLNLRYPPRFTLVSSEDDAMEQLKERNFDLIISMPSGDSINPFEWAKVIKKRYSEIPIVVLTPFSREVSRRLSREDLSAIDYVFSWLGESNLLLAITKLLEDKMNVDEDVESVGVQVILFVEDSIRFYSSILPKLYRFVFKQSRSFMTEALNDHEQMLRMRGRPKILLARTYEEAVDLYQKYKNNMLGVITDISFKKNGKKTPRVGFELCEMIRREKKDMPFIVESSEESNRKIAEQLNLYFINKNSKTMHRELRTAISDYFGFGDLVFSNPNTGEEECRVRNLKDLQDSIFKISDDLLYEQLSHNKISQWLYSRAMFPLAEFLRDISIGQNNAENIQRARQIIFGAIVAYRKTKNRGVVAIFQKDRFDQYSNFARIGNGSLGGKGRGLAFIDSMIKRNTQLDEFDGVQITVPKTLVLCTDVFLEFMESNQLYPIALSDASDEEILKEFLAARLPQSVREDLNAFLNVIKAPLAVRSSSLLEDSHYQPFAGIYSTYMVPYDENDFERMYPNVCQAVKAVYASVYYKASKAYMRATQNVIDEEKMAVVLQEICGQSYGSRYYPSFSGVVRSLNYYPIGEEKAEDGIANVAMGLGKYIVDGGMTLRFSPKHPHHVLQTSTLDFALRETQTYFYALDQSKKDFVPEVDDSFNLLKVSVRDAEQDGSLRLLASTYDVYDQVLYDGIYDGGRKVITFANILQHNAFPLAEILQEVLRISQMEMGRPVEIEFAVNLDYNQNTSYFYLLQIRPIVDTKEVISEEVGTIPKENLVISSENALGHGIDNSVYDIIYVKPETFNPSYNQMIAYEVEKLNEKMQKENRHYVLVGPGRWGSNDTWLGIPVKWPHISNARVIVESGLSNYRIEPSQGTHFFQNLTSFGVSYLTINPYNNDGFYDLDYLNSLPVHEETTYLRHVRFKKPIVIKVDGRKSLGVILKPKE